MVLISMPKTPTKTIAIAEVVSRTLASAGDAWLGAMRGTATIAGDLVAPSTESGEWEVLRSKEYAVLANR